MVVIGIIAVLMIVVLPVFTSLNDSGQVTKAAYDIAGALESARSYAIAKTTYVWVGFHEEDGSALTPTPIPSPTPPFPGRGRVILATVYSIDGTEINPLTASGSNSLPDARIRQLGKLLKIDSIHLTDVGAPPNNPPAGSRSDSLDIRSGIPYSDTSFLNSDKYNRISSDADPQTRFDFTIQRYRFWKTVRFSPRGEARLNTSYDYRRVAEIGLRPCRGNVVDINTPNVVAIQFSAFSGDFQVYRK